MFDPATAALRHRRSTGTALVAGLVTALVAGLGGPAHAVAGPNENWSFGSYYGGAGTFFADVDDDGVADVIAVGNGPTVVRRSQTNQFSFTRENWTDGPFFGSRGTALADVNGDGRADLIAVSDNGVFVRLSEGFRFAEAQNWTTDRFVGDRGTFFADVTGDGK